MTTKLKEKIVILSRNKKVEKVFKIYCCIFIIELIVNYFFKEMRILTLVMAFIGLLSLFIFDAFYAIREQTDDVLNNNKLIYIVLSNEGAVAHYIIYIGILPILLVIQIFIEVNWLTWVICLVIGSVTVIKLPKVISNYFKNKLSE